MVWRSVPRRVAVALRAADNGQKNRRAESSRTAPAVKGPAMNDLLQPLIHKAAVRDIAVHVARTGLSIGSEAALLPLPDGRIGVFARLDRRFLGVIPRKVTVLIGVLGPQASALIAPAVERDELLRVRIVGLTPEHLTAPGLGPEVHVSVWGDPRHISVWAKDGSVTTPKPLKSENAPDPGPQA